MYLIYNMMKWYERQEEQDSDKMNSVERNADSIHSNRKVKHKKNIACVLANEEDFDYTEIFTLVNNYLRWTYFGPTMFIHPWTTLVHAMFR